MDIIANTNYGKIRGLKVKGNVIRFTGIPYAKPPVGLNHLLEHCASRHLLIPNRGQA